MTEQILGHRYKIIKALGSGGFGKTFQAQDLYLPGNPLCVVKHFHPLSKDTESLKIAKRLFDKEAEILHKLGSHNQIPCLFAHFEEDGEFYLVEDFIDGETLTQEIIPGKPQSETHVRELLHSVLQVLAFVHSNNVIHRDIKPANLIRRKEDGKIVLIDFGAVKQVNIQIATSSGHSNLTVAIGSPGYTPTEQLAGRPKFSSDIYSLGVLCLEALTGLTAREIPQVDRGDEFCLGSCQNIVPISNDLATFLQKMIHFDGRDRYQHAGEALAALEQFITSIKTEDKSVLTVIQEEATVAVNSSPTIKPMATSLDTEFLECCRRELAHCIGPFANFMIDDILDQKPHISPHELVQILAKEIPDPNQAKEFQKIVC